MDISVYNYLTASVCSERTLILVSLKYQTGSIHDCKHMIGFIHWHAFPRSLKFLNLICQINRFNYYKVNLNSDNQIYMSTFHHQRGDFFRTVMTQYCSRWNTTRWL